ncbi:cold shock domain-containing protein [Shewanella sp. SNU WT4]|uniref:cold-shock protein n=1 Tax=Shewanella sp. SNU WT4 TaxID=2590015 RepID=UPI00112828E7|nr:cold shock domain-containing protein [Shewanella sp. SNU WT4]QDF68104.1 cold shock domain-containing protein [Shewanella sp. SNU WT4]
MGSLLKGKLVRWHHDQGYGFIKPDVSVNAGREVFIHISSLKQPSRPPEIGDIILFQLDRQADGKVKAINSAIDACQQTKPQPIESKPIEPQAVVAAESQPTWLFSFGRLVVIAVVILVCAALYRLYTNDSTPAAPSPALQSQAISSSAAPSLV